MHHISTKAICECIHCRFQSALLRTAAKKIGLSQIVDTHWVVGRHTNQPEGTRMVDEIKELESDRVKVDIRYYA